MNYSRAVTYHRNMSGIAGITESFCMLRFGYMSPKQMRSGEVKAILKQRDTTVREAQRIYPERWESRGMKQ